LADPFADEPRLNKHGGELSRVSESKHGEPCRPPVDLGDRRLLLDYVLLGDRKLGCRLCQGL
jgi:hypothetical protein